MWREEIEYLKYRKSKNKQFKLILDLEREKAKKVNSFHKFFFFFDLWENLRPSRGPSLS